MNLVLFKIFKAVLLADVKSDSPAQTGMKEKKRKKESSFV